MAKSFRQKNVSKKLKRKIRGGDETSDAAKKIQRLFRKRQSKKKKNKSATKIQNLVRQVQSKKKKNKSAKKIQNLVRQVQSKKKKNKSAKKIQSIVRSFSARKSIKKKHPNFREKLNDAVNIVKSGQCGICIVTIEQQTEKFEECPNEHMFHTDCLSKWCSAAHSSVRVNPENPNIWQTKCPMCTIFMNCPGSSDDIQSRRKQNRDRHVEEQFREFQQREFQQRELAARNRARPAMVTQRPAAQIAEQSILDAITAEEANIIGNIANHIATNDYHLLTRPSCMRYIESELHNDILINHNIDLDTNDNRRVTAAVKRTVDRIVNAIAEYCVQNILIPQMQREFDTAAHIELEMYMSDMSFGVERWWHLQNKEKLEVIMADYKTILGEFVVLASEQDIRERRVENVRQIGDFNFGDVDNRYLYKFFDIYEYDVEYQKDIDDLIESFEEALNTGRHDMVYRDLFDEDERLQLYNAGDGTDAEHREIIEKIGTRILKLGGHEYPSYIDMNDDLGMIDDLKMNVYIGTFRDDEDDIIDRIWAIYGPGGVYSANNNGRALLRSREEVNNPRIRTGSRSDTIYRSSNTRQEAEAEENN